MSEYTEVELIADDDYFDEDEIQKTKDKLRGLNMNQIEKLLEDIKNNDELPFNKNMLRILTKDKYETVDEWLKTHNLKYKKNHYNETTDDIIIYKNT